MKNKTPKPLYITLLLASILYFASCTTKKGESIINHSLLYNWVEASQDKDKQEFLALFKSLPNTIEGLKDISINELTLSKEGYDVIINLKFYSNKGLENYTRSSTHDSIVKKAEHLVATYSYYRFNQ